MTGIREDIVEAGAGCGKTTGLVLRYLEGLGIDSTGKDITQAKVFNPSQILALTFTDEAAQNMRLKVIEKLNHIQRFELSKEVLEHSQISTFHSFCLGLLSHKLSTLGYSGELIDTQYVRRLRTREILKYLPQFPESSTLLSAFELQDLTQLVLDHWFSVSENELLSSNSDYESKTDDSELIDSFLKNLQTQKEQLSCLMAEFPDECKKDPEHWPMLLEKILLHPLDHTLSAKDFDFRKGSKKIRSGPFEVLFEYAQATKEFLAKNFHLSLKPANIRKEVEIQALVLKFIHYLRSRAIKYLDFAALEYECDQHLSSTAAADLPPPPKLLLVDEFQDTSPAQFRIIQRLSREQSELYFVGDPKQSIYAFRKADVRLFLQQCQKMRHLKLDTNYRSEDSVLEFCNIIQREIFSKTASPLDPPAQTLKVGKTEVNNEVKSPKVGLTRSADRKTKFFQEMLNDLKSDLKTGNLKHGIGVLFRSWKRLHEFSEFLDENKVTHQISGGKHYLSHLLSGVFSDFLEWNLDPTAPQKLLSFHRWCKGDLQIYQAPTNDELTTFSEQLHHECQGRSLFGLFQVFFSHLHPPRFELGLEWAQSIEVLISSMQDREALHEVSLKDFAQILKKHSDQINAPNIADTQALRSSHELSPLRLLTIHGSKGLEFDVVYLPELFERKKTNFSSAFESDDGSLVAKFKLRDEQSGKDYPSLSFKKMSLEKDLVEAAEQKRLFYVAVTRAISKLRIYYHQSLETKNKLKGNFFSTVMGKASASPLFWNQVLDKIVDSSEFQAEVAAKHWELLDFNEEESVEGEVVLDTGSLQVIGTPASPPSDSSEKWFAPLTRSIKIPPVLPTTMGVRAWIDSLNSDPLTDVFTPSFAKPNEHALQTGKQIHSILEFWNGNPNHLASLISRIVPESQTQVQKQNDLKTLMMELLEVPKLKDYFEALKACDPRVMREVPIIVAVPNARLTGIIDALFFHSDRVITLLDWKTGASLKSLSNKDRVEKLSQQLNTYAEPFLKMGFEAQGLGIGIELPDDESPSEAGKTVSKIKIIFDEKLVGTAKFA